MNGQDRRTVRPKWVCGATGEPGEEIEEDEIQMPVDEEQEDDDEAEHGCRKTKAMLDPKLPSAEEVKKHYITHMPYRNWCPHCVRGRGKEMAHNRRKNEAEANLPEYHADYCFPGDEDGQKLTVLAVVERHTKMKRMVVVPAKGSTGRYASGVVMEFIEECGDKDRPIIIKTDQEPAIKFLVDDICVARTGAQTIVEQAPRGSKGSNGVVERAVQSMEQYLRTLKSALDERVGVRIDVRHPVLTWLCEYAGYLMNRLEVASDGKTAYERNKGKPTEVLGLEFGEKVLWKFRGKGNKMEKINARWGHGLFLGVRARSTELIVVDQETKQVNYVRTVRRIPEEQRWSAANLEWVMAVPWNRGQDDSDADGEAPEFDVKHGPGRKLMPEEVEGVAAKVVPKIVHNAHLRKADFEKYGFTDRCGGCSAILRGLHVQPHTWQCRRRMEKHLEDDLRIKNAKVRLGDKSRRIEKEQEEIDAKRQKRMREIEKAVEKEEDYDKVAMLCDEYKKEYQGGKGENEEREMKRRRLKDIENEAMVEQDAKRAGKLFEEYMHEYKRRKQKNETSHEQPSSSMDVPVYGEPGMDIDQVMGHEWMDQEWGDQLEVEEFAWDDVNDMELPLDLVRAARKEEMDYMKGKTFKVVKRQEAIEVTGKNPISTKWVDTDKSHGVGEPVVRSRWVARDFKQKGEKDREDLFSATPPLELIRYMISRQATLRDDGRERKTMFIDVKKAHLVPKCERDVYVELPPEAGVQEDECGKLLYWLYGCRPAAQAWEEHYSGVLEGVGFRRLTSSPVAFTHCERDLAGVVHGDDFIFEGLDEDLDFVLAVLEKHYELKNRGRLGSGVGDCREIDMLGRIIKWHDWGITWEGDDRHRASVLKYFGLDETSAALVKNGYKDDGDKDKEEMLDEQLKKSYRMLAARVNYIAQDNPAVQFPAKEICRRMSEPSSSDFAKLKKLARFMIGVKAVRWEYRWQSELEANYLRVFVDSDWAGCLQTRRSTSGGLLMRGNHVVRTWSATQQVVATSSAEAELYSIAEGASRGLGFQAMLLEFGAKTLLGISTDSAAAKAFASTRGLGRMRHLEVKDLWIQGLVKDRRIVLEKVRGDQNPADVLTKYLDRDAIGKGLSRVGVNVQ